MKKVLTLLLTLALLLQCIPAFAATQGAYTEKELNNEYRYIIYVEDTVSHHGYTYTVRYRFNVKSGEILDVSFPNNDVVGNYITIPSSLAGYPVKRIGSEVFQDRYYLCEVILPETVESIGENAFKNCYNLYVVKMENPEKSQLKRIENGAFDSLKLLFEVPIYEGLEFIGDEAFSYTEKIEAVTLPESLNHLGAYAFYRSSGLKDISIPETLTDIGAYAFKYTPWLDSYDADFVVEGNYVLLEYKGSATDVVLPNNVFHLPDKVFATTKITSITFNQRLKTIGDYAFEGCSYLKTALVPDTVNSIGEGIFKNCTSLSETSLPSHLTIIPPYTFYSTKITGFDLSNIDRIGEYAFAYTRFSGDLNLAYPLTYVGHHSFCYTKINSLSVTDNVYLDEYSFSQTTTLASVDIDKTVKQMGGMVFYNTHWYNSANTEFLIVGDGILIQHFTNVRIDSLKVPDTVKALASQAFSSYNGYGEIIIPDTVTVLGDHALSYANATKIVLPDTITKMGVGVFEYSRITQLVWPEGITEIPDYTFYGSNLASFDFSHITSIGNYAFNNSHFINVTIGKSVQKIGDYAFRGGRITLHHLPESLGEYPFGNRDTATSNVIPEYYVDEGVFEYNEKEDYLVLPDWVDYSVYVNITPEITEVGYDYVIVKFKNYPPKSLGCYLGTGYQTIDASHFEFLDAHTIKISDILNYNEYSIRFFEHYSGWVNFQYNPIKITGLGSSDTSFSTSNIKSVGTNARHTSYNTYFTTRISSPVDSITVTFAPTTGQSFEVYSDEACTTFKGNAIALSEEPVTVWIKVISQNKKHSQVYKWIIEYDYQANAPTFDITESVFKESLDITISSTLSDALIYYTTDGSTPSKQNGSLYNGPIKITDTTCFKAITYSSYTKPSSVVSKTYTLATDMEIDNVFPSGNYATVSLNPERCLYNRYLTLLVSTDGKNWDMSQEVYMFEDNATVMVESLTPDTLYYVKITLPSADITSNVCSFTTSNYDSKTGFSYTKDGFITGMPEKDTISIPKKIGTTSIVGIAPYSYRYVYGTISIPESITSISVAGISASSTFTVDKDNPYFCSVDGSLYNKDMTKLIRAGFSGKSNKEIIFVTPASVKEIGDYAFFDTYFTGIVFNDALEVIGNNIINSHMIKIIRIPSSVTKMGSSFFTGGRAAIIFMGRIPQCNTDTFGENVVLYSATENTTVNNHTVRITNDAEDNFTSFFKPVLSDYGIDVYWCSEVSFDENASLICKVSFKDGKYEVFTKKLSECFSDNCFFGTQSDIDSVKLFFWDMKNLSPYAYSETIIN